MKRTARRPRAVLLVLLWIWAGTVALVLDLYLDVPEFDGIRPDIPLYRGMRVVAHRRVGTPVEPLGSAEARPPEADLPRLRAAALGEDRVARARAIAALAKIDHPEARELRRRLAAEPRLSAAERMLARVR